MNVAQFPPRGVSLESLFKFTDLDRRIQQHVQKVYATLALALLVCGAGVYAYTFVPITGLFAVLPGLGCLAGLIFTPSTPQTLERRYAFLMGFAFLQGMVIAPMVTSILEVYPSAVLTAFFTTLALFASFSGAALCAKRRSMLYIGGLCSTGLWALLFMQLGSHFYGNSVWMFKAELFVGLIIFAGYILFDTQVIVERAAAGDMDHLKHTVSFLLDFLNVFIRVLAILAQKEHDRDERRKDSRKRN